MLCISKLQAHLSYRHSLITSRPNKGGFTLFFTYLVLSWNNKVKETKIILEFFKFEGLIYMYNFYLA